MLLAQMFSYLNINILNAHKTVNFNIFKKSCLNLVIFYSILGFLRANFVYNDQINAKMINFI